MQCKAHKRARLNAASRKSQDSASGTYAHNWHDRAKRKLKLQLRPCKKRLISLHCPTPGGMRTDTLQRRHCRSVKASGGRAPPFSALLRWRQAASVLRTLASGSRIICSDTVQCRGSCKLRINIDVLPMATASSMPAPKRTGQVGASGELLFNIL